MAHKYEIWRDSQGDYRVRFKYNSETIWASEGYSSKSAAQNAIQAAKRNAPDAPIEDHSVATDDLAQRLENAAVPAADRIVRIDHNSADAKEFRGIFSQLEEAIRTSNDVGGMETDEVEVAKSEIDLISAEKDRTHVRPAQVWVVAKSTLLWIAKQAAGSVIGTLALSALALLATMLGIPF